MKIFPRIVYILALIMFVGSLVYEHTFVSNRTEDRFTIEKYILEPEKYGDKRMERIILIKNISDDHFYFEWGAHDIKVLGPRIEMPVWGETVVYLNFRKDGVIELIDYHNYNYNYILYFISILAIMLFFIIFFKEWRLSKGGFENA